MKQKQNKIEVENVLHAGKIYRVDASKYEAMRHAFLKVLPKASPGFTVEEIYQAVLPHLPEALFPQGTTATWWIKTVQLDLEAKKLVARESSKPLCWYKL